MRYFFHIRSNEWIADRQGLLVYGGSNAVREAAATKAVQIMRAAAIDGLDVSDHRMEVENQFGEVVLHLPFAGVLMEPQVSSQG
jgi:hypothetical protein